MPTTIIRDVELVSAGTWAASTGVTTVTRADLESMLAAQADGLVDHAPIKLGHASSLNDKLGDGEPAYGWVVPKAIRKNAAGRDTLIGDLVGMPAKLAEVAPTAYRRRSVEIEWQVKAGAKTYSAVLTAVSLLGAKPPAVKGLADVVALYSEQPTEVGSTSTVELVDGLEDNNVAVAMLAAARQAGAGVEQLDAIADAAGARDTADVPPPATVPDHDDTRTPPAPPAPDGRTTMSKLTDAELRTKLGLEADADVEKALKGILADRGTDPVTAPTDPVAPAAPTAPVATAPVAPSAPAPQPEPATATLSASTLSELQREAAYGRDTRRAGILDKAVREGRITPAERGKLTSELGAGESVSGFAALVEQNEDQAATLLSTMASRFSTTELGADQAPNSETADKAFDDFEAETFGLDRTTPSTS